jgi:TonB family protein
VPDPPKTKSKIKVNTEIVKRGGETTPAKPSKEEIAKEQERQERAAADQRRAVARRLQAKTRSLVNTLGDSLSSSTAVEMPGPGGMAYINYRQFVKTEYEDAWIPPESVVDESATVRASVTIRRDGTVLDDKIVGPSGIPGLDKSVEAALDRVRLKGLRPFPEGARDAQRVFTIVFNLKSKRNTG